MYKLRQTWGDVFPARKLYELDLRVKEIDHAWPVTATPPPSIHFNPKFLVCTWLNLNFCKGLLLFK